MKNNNKIIKKLFKLFLKTGQTPTHIYNDTPAKLGVYFGVIPSNTHTYNIICICQKTVFKNVGLGYAFFAYTDKKFEYGFEYWRISY